MEDVVVKSAKEYLKLISLENENHSGLLRNYIFRGQRDANWKIYPSAFRENPKLFTESALIEELGSRTNREQINAEFHVIHAFCKELNETGLHISNEDLLNSTNCKETFIQYLTDVGRGKILWPNKKYLSILAIAQHYGVPTRLVDWTYDPFVAVYFAAVGAVKNCDADFLSVFAINSSASSVRRFDFETEDRPDPATSLLKDTRKFYQIINTPSYFNTNLKAQKGLFLAYVDLGFCENDTLQPYSFEQHLENSKNNVVQFGAHYKYRIATSKAEELLFLLHKRFYNAGTLFPGVEGCVKTIYEKQGLEFLGYT